MLHIFSSNEAGHQLYTEGNEVIMLTVGAVKLKLQLCLTEIFMVVPMAGSLAPDTNPYAAPLIVHRAQKHCLCPGYKQETTATAYVCTFHADCCA